MKATRALWVGGILCLGGIAVVGVQFRAPAVAPAATGSATSAEPPAESRVVASFTEFAGSEANARSLIAGLRQGGEVTLTEPEPGGKAVISTQFTLPTRPLDFGGVHTALTLAREQLAQLGISQPSPVQIKAVLAGGAVTSRSPARTTPVLLPGVLQMRAHGMSWHKIADSMGVKLGDAMDGKKGSPAPAPPGIAASAVTVTGAQVEAPTPSGAGSAAATGVSGPARPGKIAIATPKVAPKPAGAKPAESVTPTVAPTPAAATLTETVKPGVLRAPAPAEPPATAARADKGGASTAVATTDSAGAASSPDTRSPGPGAPAAKENKIAPPAVAASVPSPATEPLALPPVTRVEKPAAAGERGPAPAAPVD